MALQTPESKKEGKIEKSKRNTTVHRGREDDVKVEGFTTHQTNEVSRKNWSARIGTD